MGRNILVVEDDRNICDLIHMYLVKEGFDVRIAGDGGKAIEEFQKQVPDLILLDIMLPVMDGWSVCAKIRETSKVPIIMLTAKSEVFDRIQGLEMGADDYIVKPFEMKELIARINRTNSTTEAGEGRTLSDLLARRECMTGRLRILRDFLNSASAVVNRRTVGEIRIRSAVNVRELQKQVDRDAKALRELDETIQEKNWTTELVEL